MWANVTSSIVKKLWLVAALGVAAASCGGSDDGGWCKPPGFTNCDGNTLQTCVQDPKGPDGKLVAKDCTAEGLVCSGTTTSSCRKPQTESPCHARNSKSCTAGNEIVRCVWVSEQPHPSVSGDIGVWRVEKVCTGACQVTGGNATCSP